MQWKNLCACLVLTAAVSAALPSFAQQPGTQPATQPGQAQNPGQNPGRGGRTTVPADLKPLLGTAKNEMQIVRVRYDADRRLLLQTYNVAASTLNAPRMKRFDVDWQTALDKIDATKLTAPAQAMLNQVKAAVKTNLQADDQMGADEALVLPLMPFAGKLTGLEESRRQLLPLDAEKAAVALMNAGDGIAGERAALAAALSDKTKLTTMKVTKAAALRTADVVTALAANMQAWNDFYDNYDPMYMWWMSAPPGQLQPFGQLDAALKEYATFLRQQVAPAAEDVATAGPGPIEPAAAPKFEEVPDLQAQLALPQNEMFAIVQQFSNDRRANQRNAQFYESWLAALKTLDFDSLSRNAQIDYLHMRNTMDVAIKRINAPAVAATPRKADTSDIPGTPIGKQAMEFDIADEIIPYTPEELLALADHEYAWCESEMKKASNEMGLGDDWKKAVEIAKQRHVPAGKQPDMISDLIGQSVDFLRKNDLITVPQIDVETLKMEMMSPKRQEVNPFFTGGALISVSYPTFGMTTEQKIESMRGNNWDLARATVHHELIPGHNLQWYLSSRYRATRGGDMGTTPFYGEGWAVYWEIQFYNKGYPRTPEERVGFLYWRMMRCVRITFSLNFHLGNWSPQECVDFMVDKVGSERENAIAEIRRSFGGGYGPLYQAGYLLGALQFLQLRKDLVEGKQMTEREFNDAVMFQPSMPVELVRLALTKQKLTADMPLDWKFYGEHPGK